MYTLAGRHVQSLLVATGNVSNAPNSTGATSAVGWLVLLRKHQKGGPSTAYQPAFVTEKVMR